ncbi:MAG: L-fucose isomerase, partial [Promethearchaeota archaeon]
MGKKRLKGAIPKIGIRPTIDGRELGVREALEYQTMNMARNCAKLLSENLKYPNGCNVECIIADTTIGGVSEAMECAEKFHKENVGVSITVTPSWCYGAETMDMTPHIPKAIWGFNGTERPGAVYLAAVLAAHSQKGIPAFGIYGQDVQDMNDNSIPEDVQHKLLRFAKAGLAVAWMKDKSYLSIGSVSMGIAGSIIIEQYFQDYLGMRNEYVDMSEIIRRLKQNIFDPEEFKLALNWVKENLIEGKDHNPPDLIKNQEQKDNEWDMVIKMAMIVRD